MKGKEIKIIWPKFKPSMPPIVGDFKPLLLIVWCRPWKRKGCVSVEASKKCCMTEGQCHTGAYYSPTNQWVAELYFGAKPVTNKEICSWVLQAKYVSAGRRVIPRRRAKILAMGENRILSGVNTAQSNEAISTSFFLSSLHCTQPRTWLSTHHTPKELSYILFSFPHFRH